MKIEIEINDCEQCYHIGHSGMFTPGGAKDVCGHRDAVELATARKWVNKKDSDDRYHWRHRVLKGHIPYWCPLKNGKPY